MQKLMQKLSQLSSRSLYWGVFVVLIFIPLYMKLPLLGVSGTFVSVRLEDILIGLVIGVWSLNVIITNEWRSLLSDKLHQAIVIFFFVGLISLFSATFLTNTIDLKLGLLHFLRRIQLVTFL